MLDLQCDVCGGKLIKDDSNEFSTCESCGTNYTADTIRSMMQELEDSLKQERQDADASEEEVSVDSLLKQARQMCENNEFRQARTLANRALTMDTESGEAYLIALMVDFECAQEEMLGELVSNELSYNNNFQNALRLGDEALKAKLEGYDQQAKENFAEKQRRRAEALAAAKQLETLINDSSGASKLDSIKWQMLDVDEDDSHALFITRDCIEKMPYHEPGNEITWEECTLRAWLNTTFYDDLPKLIKSRVIEVENKNPVSPFYRSPGGKPTKDKVFLLTFDEATRYFKSDSERKAKIQKSLAWWWLRSPGDNANNAAYVSYDGSIDATGYKVDYNGYGVRPASWLNL